MERTHWRLGKIIQAVIEKVIRICLTHWNYIGVKTQNFVQRATTRYVNIFNSPLTLQLEFNQTIVIDSFMNEVSLMRLISLFP